MLCLFSLASELSCYILILSKNIKNVDPGSSNFILHYSFKFQLLNNYVVLLFV